MDPLSSLASLFDASRAHARLRQTDPVHWSEQLQCWFLTRYEDVAHAFRDPRLSSARSELFIARYLADKASLTRDYLRLSKRSMLMTDGADHARLRKEYGTGFTHAFVKSWRPVVARVMDELLAAVRDQGRMELVSDFSAPLVPLILMELFDIPTKDRKRFRTWIDAAGKFGNVLEAGPVRRANDSMRRMEKYLLRHLLRNEPEERMDVTELISNVILTLTAGYVATSDQLSTGVYNLLIHPNQRLLLRERPELLTGAVEEVLRYTPSAPLIYRIALDDIPMGGKVLRSGQWVCLAVAAANRDPTAFHEPDCFDITRKPNRHLSFASGPHTCLGAALARQVLARGLEVLFHSQPGLRLDPERSRQPKFNGGIFYGFHSLPLVFSS
ncbi:cytochrome P450 [Vitiosangium sp. GDMCC 1.1324]|uniref:cytochrome P450 n=1 Tax=Vitiosangium sp. (strain GDMCC 1.1324) TaxID=2138576 RepID=UPI000D3647CD|nr:cytochrome P450 [Vitiosangium sp. GDMCC 1.1324]PTL82231.1 cytochrome P450 [Vitiosangium sp. GDMCC 1.1324]